MSKTPPARPLRRIGIDAFNLALPKGSGIATYARNLNQALRDLGHATDLVYGPINPLGKVGLLNEVSLFDASTPPPAATWLRRAAATASLFGNRSALPVPASAFVQARNTRPQSEGLWAARDLYHRANRAFASRRRFTSLSFSGAKAPDLMHWTCPLPLRARGMANVYTIHDLVPLRLPFATLDDKRAFYALCRRICRRADHVVTVSESARRDLIDTFGIEESRITNTYQAVHLPEALTAKSDEETCQEIEGVFGLGWKRYFLFFGAIEPKKNLGRVIEAYLASGATDPLVIIGGQAWLAEDEVRLLYEDIVSVQVIQENMVRRSDRIRRYDYLPLPALVSLIRGAKATLFPSLYEGFGLPVLESMLLGTAVLTSSAGSLPEVAGDAALVVDAWDSTAIKRGIQALDADESLRTELVAKGRVQAARFSPKAYGERLADLQAKLV